MSYIDFDRNFTISNNNNNTKEYFVENLVERITDRIVLEKTPCTFDNQKVKSWEDFFKYLNDQIIEEMKDGYYSLELKLPKDLFVRYNNALKVIIKFLIFKQRMVFKFYAFYFIHITSYNLLYFVLFPFAFSTGYFFAFFSIFFKIISFISKSKTVAS